MPKLGQHFLVNSDIADRIVMAAGITSGESVVEIGPGEGILTQRLVSSGARVTAVELDSRLYRRLEQKFEDVPGLNLVHADFLKLDLGELPSPSAFVANLPYAVAAPMLQRILSWPGWSRAVLMFQKEVAQRLLAQPGSRKYGLLTVSALMKANVTHICDVPRKCFRPPPKVDSAVVRLDPRAEPLLPPALTEERFMSVVSAAFAHRRKTLINSLSRTLDAINRTSSTNPLLHRHPRAGGGPSQRLPCMDSRFCGNNDTEKFSTTKEKLEEAMKAAGLDLKCRAEDVSPEQFVNLCQKFSF